MFFTGGAFILISVYLIITPPRIRLQAQGLKYLKMFNLMIALDNSMVASGYLE